MRRRTSLKSFVSVFVLFIATLSVQAQQSDFFWSIQGLNQDAVNAPVSQKVAPGDSVSLYLYFTTNGPSEAEIDLGAILDIAVSQEGVINFQNAESFDFPVSIANTEVGQRWGDLCSKNVGQIGVVTDSFIRGWGALTPFDFGMTNSTVLGNVFEDEGYDQGAQAFLFGRIDFDVVGGHDSCVQIQIGPGTAGIVNNAGITGTLLQPVFGSATFIVGGFPPVLGDLSGDGTVNLLDVAPFVNALQNQVFSFEADTNCDGELNLLDIGSFVALVSGDALPVTDPTPAAEPNFGQFADVNEDGFVDLRDLSCMSDFPVTCGLDVNGDGSIDLLDICPLIQIILQEE